MKKPDSTIRLLTLAEAASILKISKRTLHRMIQHRQIPAFKVGGQWRFRREDIETWIGLQTQDTRIETSNALVERRNGQRRRTRRTGPR